LLTVFTTTFAANNGTLHPILKKTCSVSSALQPLLILVLTVKGLPAKKQKNFSYIFTPPPPPPKKKKRIQHNANVIVL